MDCMSWSVSLERGVTLCKASRQQHKEVQINQRNTDFLKHAGQRLSLKNLPHHHGIAHTRPSAHVRNILD